MSVAQICRAELIRARAQFTRLCLSYVFGGCECFIWMHVEESIKEYSNTIREASHSSQSRLLSQSHYPLHMVVSQYTGKTCLPLFCIKIFLVWHIWFFSFHPPNYMFFFCIQKGKNNLKTKIKTSKMIRQKIKTNTHTHTDGVHFVLINCSQAWCLPWNVVDISHSQKLSVTFLIPRSSQLQTASWLKVEFCVLFSFLVLGCCLIWAKAGLVSCCHGLCEFIYVPVLYHKRIGK